MNTETRVPNSMPPLSSANVIMWRRQLLPNFAGLVACLLSVVVGAPVTPGQQRPNPDASLLPFVTTDAVLQRNALSGQITKLTGVIEDLSGDVVQLRRGGGGRVERYRLRDVTEIQFIKSPDFDRGLVHMQTQEWNAAIDSFEAALLHEQRIWVQREVLASSAEALLALGRHADVLVKVLKIAESDPATRHAGLLPLVWDGRIGTEQRFLASPSGLSSTSPLLQLTTASVLLDDPQQQTAAAETLTRLRVNSQPHIQELAEAQLWRLRLLHPEMLKKIDTELWSDRVREFGRSIRSGPEFVLGRALMLQHNYDAAAMHLMWPSSVGTADRQLIKISLTEAAMALKQSGRPAEAALAIQELAVRFPDQP